MIKTFLPTMQAKLEIAFAIFAIASLGLFVSTASADSLSIDFEDPPYVLGSISGQDGWSNAVNPAYDQEVDSSFGTAGFGAQSLRMSNAVTSGSFGDWVFSKSLGDEAGETLAENGGMSGGTRQTHFAAEFDLASVMPNTEQTGLQISVSPDRGDGARMSYLRFDDLPDGVHVVFFDYQDGVVEPAGTCATGDNFIGTDVATLDRTLPHTIRFEMDFVDGPNNDIVRIYIDGALVHTGTSWEGYFNYCEGNPTRTVDSLLFQARTSAGTAPATLGAGYLFDNLSLLSGVTPPPGDGGGNGTGVINSSLIKIEAKNSGSVDNTTSSSASTGGNTANGSRGGRGGRGGSVKANGGGFGSDATGNNGGASAGSGGTGGDASIGGFVETGNSFSHAETDNSVNGTDVEIGNLATINSSAVKVEADNDNGCGCNTLTNDTRAKARTGRNVADGSYGGRGGSGGEVKSNAGGFGSDATGNNGGASAGSGGSGGIGSIGGIVFSGAADSVSSTTNKLNMTRIRITN